GACTAVLGGPRAMVTSVAYSPDGSRIYFASIDGSITAWNSREKQAAWKLNVASVGSEGLFAMACARDGTRAAVSCNDGKIRFVDLAAGKFVDQPTPQLKLPCYLCFDASGTSLVTGAEDSTLRVWDVA